VLVVVLLLVLVVVLLLVLLLLLLLLGWLDCCLSLRAGQCRSWPRSADYLQQCVSCRA
jgi:hypothetical protein